jgi:RNA polymerase sigma-70 factor (ECF subfamily)
MDGGLGRNSSAKMNYRRRMDSRAFEELVGPHRSELRAYCYRMSGSVSDADDLLQESLIRAWKNIDRFEGRAALRTWLYRVTQSACIDALDKKRPRLLPLDAVPAARATDPIPDVDPEAVWLEPCGASLYADLPASPEARYATRESVALAFLAALQLLPPKQRAILLARDVLGWTAEECADAFETTVASVNSALQRARETIDARAHKWKPNDDDEKSRALVARYVEAWELSDAARLAALLHEDATLAMPPMPLWLASARDIVQSIGAMVFARTPPGALRFEHTTANGAPALLMRRGDALESLHVLTIRDGRIAAIDAFLDPRVVQGFAGNVAAQRNPTP